MDRETAVDAGHDPLGAEFAGFLDDGPERDEIGAVAGDLGDEPGEQVFAIPEVFSRSIPSIARFSSPERKSAPATCAHSRSRSSASAGTSPGTGSVPRR